MITTARRSRADACSLSLSGKPDIDFAERPSLTHLGHLAKNGATQTDHCVAFRGSQIPVL